MNWTHRPEQRLGRKFRTGGREVIGTKQTHEILGPEDADGFREVVAKGLTPENAKMIVDIQSTIARLTSEKAAKDEALGMLDKYAKHRPTCYYAVPEPSCATQILCTCGLHAALAAFHTAKGE